MSVTTTAGPLAPAGPARPGAQPAERRRRRPRSPLGSRVSYTFLAPFFFFFAAFSLFPFVYTAWVSLHKIELTNVQKSKWVGFGNYSALLDNPRFWKALWNTIEIGVMGATPQIILGLGLAHLLNYKLRGRTFFRVAILTPYATSIAAATLIFAQVFAREGGIVNSVIRVLGGHTIDWEAGTWTSKMAIAAIVIWRWTGYTALIFLASMQAISKDLYEAANIDGSNRWQDFRYVTLPSLRPTIGFVIITSTIGSLQMFGEPLLFTTARNTAGGTQNQYQTLGLLMYDQGWTNFHLGQAAATAWSMFLIIVLVVGGGALIARLATRARRRREGIA